MTKKKIAVIGMGASGTTALYVLDEHYNNHGFEKDQQIGGHVHTQKFDIDDKEVQKEVGVQFINEKYYPHLMAILKHQNLTLKPYTLTSHFTNKEAKLDLKLPPFYHDDNGKFKIEWGTLFSFKNLKIMIQMAAMLSHAKQVLFDPRNMDMSLEEFIEQVRIPVLGTRLSEQFKHDFLYPLLSSAFFIPKEDGPDLIKKYRAYYALNFPFQGFDSEVKQWLNVVEGLIAYQHNMIAECSNSSIHTETEITALEAVDDEKKGRFYKLKNNEGNYICNTEGEPELFCEVILALPANVSAKLLKGIAGPEPLRAALKKVQYHGTEINIHNDETVLPEKDPRLVNTNADGQSISITDPIAKNKVIKTANGDPAEESTIYTVKYEHPILDENFSNVSKVIGSEFKAIMTGEKQDYGIHLAGIVAQGCDSQDDAISGGLEAARHAHAAYNNRSHRRDRYPKLLSRLSHFAYKPTNDELAEQRSFQHS